MFSSFGPSVSGMNAALRMLDVSASNTANAFTNGFCKQAVALNDTRTGVAAKVVQSTAPGPLYMDAYGAINRASNVDLGEEVTSQIIAKHYFEANLAAFKKAAQTEKSVIDIIS